MGLTLTKEDRDAIVQQLLVALRKEMKALRQPEMVTTSEAAKILGISDGRMRQIADQYPHIKKGDHKQGQLLFKREALVKM